MTLKRLMMLSVLASLAIAGTLSARQASQVTPTVKRTPLQTFDVPDTRYETVMAIAEIGPDAHVGRHTHPGVEAGYVLEGGITLLIEGRPPLTLKAGDSFQVPPGAVHQAHSGPAGVKVIGTYVVEKGKPLASPVQ